MGAVPENNESTKDSVFAEKEEKTDDCCSERVNEEPSSSSSDGEKLSNGHLVSTGIIAGLLSSSCCLLQLGFNILSWLNVVHVGCVGFNKVLTPQIRLYCRAITIGWLGITWFSYFTYNKGTDTQRNKTTKTKTTRARLIQTTIITVLLMFLPEFLQSWNNSHPIIKRSLAPFQNDDNTIHSNWKERKFVVPFMSCEGCETAVKAILEASDAVEAAQVDYKAGVATVWGEHVYSEQFDLQKMRKELEWHGWGLDEDMNAPTGF
mmetsp:Transcript_30003/g.42558  ORF Transcript_30003/g.42558 Transcript_30003/m.42558 type:complete len:263 (-) Transcript_30003:128-916(-)|eukprot:CAMPEP_0202467180 /NCGR_PEP_ID=MMETSP1360-20130828/71165_1 /ASSEMBLY_ACC=CAM_ASM_000848 /TAXON_ID=515479 /ORGANISM="Licmophora paradoxa, Strain CCMP2313" /LENGTH=262 /DNA_ID=CAMNT_0049091609 /DNA_START=62 /DNA_END=850 /DNA_ORIENTATION=-